jgi:hypothetical protein
VRTSSPAAAGSHHAPHAHGEIRRRGVTQPDAAQVPPFDRLGLVLPQRNGLPQIGADTAALGVA